MSTRAESIEVPPAGNARLAVYRVLEIAHDKNLFSRVADIALITLIGLSVAAVILESVPSIGREFAAELYWFEVFTVLCI